MGGGEGEKFDERKVSVLERNVFQEQVKNILSLEKVCKLFQTKILSVQKIDSK